MAKILIFGNAGSGKSTLAKALADRDGAQHLDLDGIAWKADHPGVRADFEESRRELLQFIEQAENWVVEGCYTSLLEVAAARCTEMIFLNPGVEACVANCRARPWEPHKYPSREAQDANIEMLIGWVREYATRTDEFSLREHWRLFDSYKGKKTEYRSNAEDSRALGDAVRLRETNIKAAPTTAGTAES